MLLVQSRISSIVSGWLLAGRPFGAFCELHEDLAKILQENSDIS